MLLAREPPMAGMLFRFSSVCHLVRRAKRDVRLLPIKTGLAGNPLPIFSLQLDGPVLRPASLSSLILVSSLTFSTTTLLPLSTHGKRRRGETVRQVDLCPDRVCEV